MQSSLTRWWKIIFEFLNPVVAEAAEATGEFIGSKIADIIVKAKPVAEGNLRNVEEIIISPEKGEEIPTQQR